MVLHMLTIPLLLISVTITICISTDVYTYIPIYILPRFSTTLYNNLNSIFSIAIVSLSEPNYLVVSKMILFYFILFLSIDCLLLLV